MTTIDFISYLLPKLSYKLTRSEKRLLEAKLFTFVFKEVSKDLMDQYKENLMHTRTNQKSIFCSNFVQKIIKDILSTEEYSLTGISIYTDIPEDVLFEIVTGINSNPTIELARKILELHVVVRRQLYDSVMKKVLSTYPT